MADETLTPEQIEEGLRYAEIGCNEFTTHARRHHAAALRQLQAQATELGRLRASLKECWDAAGLLDEGVTGQPWQHYDPDSVRRDLLPQIAENSADAELLREVEAERDAARALAARLAAAMIRATDEGSVDHLNCGPDHGRHWYDALADARAAGLAGEGGR